MIGLALVTLVATLAAGITQTFRGAVNDLFVADYAITAQNNFSPIPIAVSRAASKAPGVTAAGSVRTGDALVFGKAGFIDRRHARRRGRDRHRSGRLARSDVLSSLGADGAFVDNDYAKKHNLSVGIAVPGHVRHRGDAHVRRQGNLRPTDRWLAVRLRHDLGATWDAENPQPKDLYAFFKMQGGASRRQSGRARDDGEAVPERQGADPRRSSSTTRSRVSRRCSTSSTSCWRCRSLVSLFGIVNTLVLTVFERTREIGMLRAIGMTRRQVRRMIRYESVITALIGAVDRDRARRRARRALLIAVLDFVVFAVPCRAGRSSSRSRQSWSGSSRRSSRRGARQAQPAGSPALRVTEAGAR